MIPTLIITRPMHVAEKMARDFRAAIPQPFDVILSPLLKIVPCEVSGFNTDPDHVIFTSTNAVAQVDRIGLSRRGMAWCVGKRTAQAATAAGFNAKSVNGMGRDLLDLIKSRDVSGTMLHVHGREIYVDFAKELGDACDGICVYDQILHPPNQAALNALKGDAPVVVPLYSPRTAHTLTKDVKITAPTWLIGISAHTQDRLNMPQNAVRWKIAATPDHKGMLDATRLVFTALEKQSSA